MPDTSDDTVELSPTTINDQPSDYIIKKLTPSRNHRANRNSLELPTTEPSFGAENDCSLVQFPAYNAVTNVIGGIVAVQNKESQTTMPPELMITTVNSSSVGSSMSLPSIAVNLDTNELDAGRSSDEPVERNKFISSTQRIASPKSAFIPRVLSSSSVERIAANHRHVWHNSQRCVPVQR